MAKNKYKPIPLSKQENVFKDPLCKFLAHTGARTTEAVRVIKEYNGEDVIYVFRKGSKSIVKDSIYLNKTAKMLLESGLLNKYNDRYKISKHAKNVLKDNGLVGEMYTAHSMRATFATKMLSRGVDLVSVSTLMNHKDIKTTAAYIQMDEETLMNGVNVLEDSGTCEGMNVFELKNELIKQRMRINRLEEKNERLEKMLKDNNVML